MAGTHFLPPKILQPLSDQEIRQLVMGELLDARRDPSSQIPWDDIRQVWPFMVLALGKGSLTPS
jgi:hypothetical protein